MVPLPEDIRGGTGPAPKPPAKGTPLEGVWRSSLRGSSAWYPCCPLYDKGQAYAAPVTQSSGHLLWEESCRNA